MGKKELVNAMFTDINRVRNARGWSPLARNIEYLSNESYQKMLDWGIDRFSLIVEEDDFEATIAIARAWRMLSEENVDVFLELQRQHAPATPLVDGTVVEILRAWFNSCVGSALPQ